MRSICLAASLVPPVPAAGQTGYMYYSIKPVRRLHPECEQARNSGLFRLPEIVLYQSPYLCCSILFCAVFHDGLNDICHVPDFVLAYNGGRFFFGYSSIHLNTSPFLKIRKRLIDTMDFNRTAVSSSLTGVSPRPMLMGAPRNAVWAFNAGVSLCLLRCRRPQAATLVLRRGIDRSAFP